MKKDVILFAATLAMMSLTSCSENTDKPHVESKPESSQTENVVINFDKEYIADTSDFNYIQGINYLNNKLFMYGVTDSDVKVDNSFELLDTSTNESRNFKPELKFRSIDRYCIGEKGIYISYADEKYESRLALADIKTGKIITDVVQEKFFSVIDMHTDADGRLWVIKNNTIKSNVEYTADVYSDDLVLQETFSLSQKLKMSEFQNLLAETSYDRSTYILSFVYDDGPVYRIYRFSADFSVNEFYDIPLKDDIEFQSDQVGIFADKTGNVYISSVMEETSIELYSVDFENSALVLENIIDNAMTVYPGTDDYDLIYRTNFDDGGIYGYNFSDSQGTILCSSQNETALDMTVSRKAASYGNYILISTENESMVTQCMLNSIDIHSKNKSQVKISDGSFPESTQKLYIAENGEIYCFKHVCNIADPNSEEDFNQYFTGHYDKNGKYVSDIDVTSYIGDGEGITVDSIYSDTVGNIYIVYHTDGSLGLEMTFYLVCDAKGNQLMHEPLTDSCNCACIINSGKTVIVSGNDSTELFEFDIENAALLDSEEINTEIKTQRIINIYPGQGMFDFYYADMRMIYGYISDSKESEKIFSKDDINDEYNNSSIQMFCPCGEKDVICSVYDDTDEIYNEEFYLFKRK